MSNMNYLGKFINNFKHVYSEINAATLTGAIDVVVVEQPDGSFTCSPFHVRFGKIGVLRSREKVVDIVINGEPVDIHMKLGESGEAFFVEEVSADELGDDSIPPHLACSPIPREGSFHERYLLQDNDLNTNLNWTKDSEENRLKDGEVELSNTPKVVVAGGGNVVKTFKAETVEVEAGRKLSVASSEFKPITSDSLSERESGSSTDSIPTKTLSGLDLNKEDESPSSERTSTAGTVSKRKRRKRSILKKKNNNNAQRRNSNIDQSDVSAALNVQPEKDQTDFDPIFQIEDLDQKGANVSANVPSQLELLNTSNSEELAHIKDAPVETDLHFFSDTELTPGCRVSREETADDASFHVITASSIITVFPHDNRQFTPVQSDSELETKRVVEGEEGKPGDQGHQQSWRWGELPTSTYDSDPNKQSAQRSVLADMLGFMKRTKHIRHNSSSQEGIYLSDINPEELDPEVAALYFSTNYRQSRASGQTKTKDEDTESGNGPSLPHSPHSVEGAIGGPKSLDSDFEEPKKLFGSEVAMSLCGGLTATSQPTDEAFLHHIITYNEFIANPSIVNNPNLVVRIDGKMFTWRVASPIITAWAAFQKPLPQDVVSRLNTEGVLEGVSDTRQRRSYSSWFTWGVRSPERPGEPMGQNTTDAPTPDSPDSVPQIQEKEQNPTVEPVKSQVEIEIKPPKTKEETSNSSDSDSDNEHKRLKSQSLVISLNRANGSDKFRKTLRLSSEQIASLNLKDGVNRVEFSVTTAYQGTSRCQCDIFKWRYDDKIVVSDIDGTITKSDVLGHVLPLVGKDWAQSGVAKLFTKIEQNGYKILYLSARAIGQSRLTRDYLQSIKQDQLTMPDGPMLLNPTSLINAFHTEVIEKKPEEFKISCLRDIQALFPPNSQPFYAGYGNRINDVWAYQAVGIPIVRIFTINHRGELKHELTQTFQSSYTNMTHIVDQMFPTKRDGGILADDFSQFVYWREPIPDIQIV